MKTEYKGHEITVTREASIAGHDLIFYSIFRTSDWFECTSGYDESGETPEAFTEILKARIDRELEEPDPWDEKFAECAYQELTHEDEERTEIEFFVDGDFKIKEP